MMTQPNPDDPNTTQDDPHGPNKFTPVHHEPFPDQPIDPDRD